MFIWRSFRFAYFDCIFLNYYFSLDFALIILRESRECGEQLRICLVCISNWVDPQRTSVLLCLLHFCLGVVWNHQYALYYRTLRTCVGWDGAVMAIQLIFLGGGGFSHEIEGCEEGRWGLWPTVTCRISSQFLLQFHALIWFVIVQTFIFIVESS
jgi:hypothetical protein